MQNKRKEKVKNNKHYMKVHSGKSYFEYITVTHCYGQLLTYLIHVCEHFSIILMITKLEIRILKHAIEMR